MKLIVIGIAGKARVGKTTLSLALMEHLTFIAPELFTCVVMSLADPLKDECASATRLPRAWFDDPAYKETLRPLMQWWGTEFRRNPLLNGDDYYWIDKAEYAINENYVRVSADYTEDDETRPKAFVAILPDVRFDNEARLVRSYENCGVMINLLGDGAEETVHSAHVSEKGIDPDLFTTTFTTYHEKGVVDLKRVAEEIYDNQISPIISR